MQISLGFLRDIVKKTQKNQTHAAKLYCIVMNVRFAELPLCQWMHSGCRPGTWKALRLVPSWLCQWLLVWPRTRHPFLCGSVFIRGHRERERDEVMRLSTTGHSEVEGSRTNIAAVFLQGSVNWGGVALFLMIFLWQILLNLSYSFSYPYSIVYLWPCVSLVSFYRAGPLLEPQHL